MVPYQLKVSMQATAGPFPRADAAPASGLFREALCGVKEVEMGGFGVERPF